MKPKIKFKTFILLPLFAVIGLAEEKDEANPFLPLLKELQPVIEQYYPDVLIEQNVRELRLQAKTMEFTIHRILRDGSIQEETYMDEGPTHKGFMMVISNFRNRRYNGPLEVPQVLTKPYWSTFVNEVERNENYYWVRFHFGSKINSKFKTEVMNLLKKN